MPEPLRKFLSWLFGPLTRRLFKGGVQGDDAPDGWQTPEDTP
jgi:hypothetical protein